MKQIFTGKTAGILYAALVWCGMAAGQTATPFGFEDNTTAGWTGQGSSESVAINSNAAHVRTGGYSLRFSSTSSSGRYWYNNTPYMPSASNVYVHYIYWAKTEDAGSTWVDASLRYSSSTPPSGGGSTSNSGDDVELSTTVWKRVCYNHGNQNNRNYFPAPRKESGTSFYMDDAILYNSGSSTTDTVAPGTPAGLAGQVSGNLVDLTWTTATDAGTGATGVQAVLLLRTANLSAATPVLHHQARYSTTGGVDGPDTAGDWTIIQTTIHPAATSFLEFTAPPGSYKYAVVLRDLAHNYSEAAVSATVVVGTPVPSVFVNTTGFSGNFGTLVTGSTSAPERYSVTGYNLTSNIGITAPSGFQVSLSGTSGFASSVVVPQSGGTVAATDVFVRYAPVLPTGPTGNLDITHTSTGAAGKTVTVSGTALATEPATTGSISFGTITDTLIEVNLPTVGNGSRRIIVVREEDDVTFVPADGTAPAGVQPSFRLATDQGGGRIVYDGNGSGNRVVTVTGLTRETTYYFAVFEYNQGTGASQNYLPVSPFTALARTGVPVTDTPAAVGNLDDRRNVLIYPNPFREDLFVASSGAVQVRVTDLAGRIHYTGPGGRIRLTGIPEGMYLILVTDNQGRTYLRERILHTR